MDRFLLKRSSGKNKTKYVSYGYALAAQKNGSGIIIDVREPAEFRDGRIPNAINLPSTQFALEDYQAWRHVKFCLVCGSVAKKPGEAGVEEIYALEPGTAGATLTD